MYTKTGANGKARRMNVGCKYVSGSAADVEAAEPLEGHGPHAQVHPELEI